MTETVDSPDLVGVAEAADLTGYDRRTIHRKAQRGELHVVKKIDGLRGSYLFNRADVLALTPASGSDAA